MLYRLSKFTFGPCRARMSNPPTVRRSEARWDRWSEARWDRRSESRWDRRSDAGWDRRSEARWDRRYTRMRLLGPVVWGNFAVNTRKWRWRWFKWYTTWVWKALANSDARCGLQVEIILRNRHKASGVICRYQPRRVCISAPLLPNWSSVEGKIHFPFEKRLWVLWVSVVRHGCSFYLLWMSASLCECFDTHSWIQFSTYGSNSLNAFSSLQNSSQTLWKLWRILVTPPKLSDSSKTSKTRWHFAVIV